MATRNVPWIVLPVDEIDPTWLCRTAVMKYGLNGTCTLGCPAGRATSAELKFRAKSPTTSHTNQRDRRAGRPPAGLGVPLPSGAGATLQPPSSRGIGPSGVWGVIGLRIGQMILHRVVAVGRPLGH